MANLKPSLATTCIARNLEFPLTQLKSHLESGSPREVLVDSSPLLFQVVAFISDTLAESFQMLARSLALAAQRGPCV